MDLHQNVRSSQTYNFHNKIDQNYPKDNSDSVEKTGKGKGSVIITTIKNVNTAVTTRWCLKIVLENATVELNEFSNNPTI